MAESIEKSIVEEPVLNLGGVNCGSTLLNLAMTGDARQGFQIGLYTLVVGDSAAGKTFLAINALAEACLDSRFDGYDLVYDNVEYGCQFDLLRLFHQKLVDRLEAPSKDSDGEPVYSTTAEEFYYNLDDRLNSGRPCIYVLDSMDGLGSDSDDAKFEETKKAHRAGKAVAGSYGDGKAKLNSAGLRRVMSKLRETGSIVIILAQTRDNIGFGFEKKTRSGGRALKFYASMEVWGAVAGSSKKKIGAANYQNGIHSLWKVKKNRATGLLREVMFDIYPSYGIDDMGSCVDFLIENGRWEGKQKIDASELGLRGSRSALIKAIEDRGLQSQVIDIVQEVWDEIEERLKLDRRPRYGDADGTTEQEVVGES